jgi:hypothetical protein
MSDRTRPRSVVLVALGLFGLSLFSGVAGLGMTWASNCCGSSDPADGSYAFVGLLVAGLACVAGVGLWSGSMSRRVLAGCTLTVPAVCAVAALSSSDFAGLLIFAVPAWGLFWWFLGRPRIAAWLAPAPSVALGTSSPGITKPPGA